MIKKQKKQNKSIVNHFYKLAEKYRKEVTYESEIETKNITNEFYLELEEMVKRDEIIILNINGKTRLGKSTAGIAIGKNIHQLLKRYKKKKGKFGMKNIARDQQEYSKKMRNPELRQDIVVTDESNELEKTGENVTAENALRQVFSDVQAGRYIHTVSCSPKEVTDPNADILLTIFAVDKELKTTKCKLYYRYYEGMDEQVRLLGYVDIYVGNIIKTWDKIKDIFYKIQRTEKEEKLLKEAIDKDFYVEYMVKKYEKMELITKEGIFRPRLLDYAHIILKIYDELKPLTKKGKSILTKNIVKNFVKVNMRKNKIPQSIIGEELTTNEVQGILELEKGYWDIDKELVKLHEKFKTQKITADEYNVLSEQFRSVRKTLSTSIDEQIKEYKKLKELNEKYHDIKS